MIIELEKINQLPRDYIYRAFVGLPKIEFETAYKFKYLYFIPYKLINSP